jgi:hypothetical protein
VIRALARLRAERGLGPRQAAALAVIRASRDGVVCAGGPVPVALVLALARKDLIVLTVGCPQRWCAVPGTTPTLPDY